MNNYQKSRVEKIGKYFRPIFWSFLMVFSFLGLLKFFESLFLPDLRHAIGFFFGTFIALLLIIVFILAIYKVTHPYISKNDYDERDGNWGVAVYLLTPFIVIHILLKLFFGFDFIGFIFYFLFYLI